MARGLTMPKTATAPVAAKPGVKAAAKPVVAKPVVQGPPKPTPKKYLQDLFAQEGIGESKLPKRFMNGDFVRPDDKECESYNDAARLVRTNDLEKLRVLHEEGKNLDACNRDG